MRGRVRGHPIGLTITSAHVPILMMARIYQTEPAPAITWVKARNGFPPKGSTRLLSH